MITINATLILTILNFIFLVIILRAILFKPLIRFLDERAKKIDESLKLAEENKRLSEEIKLEQERIIREARIKAAEIYDSSVGKASLESSEILSRAQKEAQATVKSAKYDIQKEAERAKHSLKQEMMSLISSLTGKILEREVDIEDHRRLIEKNFDLLEKK